MNGRVLFALLCLALFFVENSVRADEGFFDSNGVKIHYLVAGKGEPVVLVHGLGANIDSWRQAGPDKVSVFDGLAKDYRVFAMDCRGHGKSDKPHDVNQYGNEMVEDVVRLLDHFKIPKAHIVGYSMGASIACYVLVKHSDRVLSVTLGAGCPMYPASYKGRQAFLETWAVPLAKRESKDPFLSQPGQDQQALAATIRGMSAWPPLANEQLTAIKRLALVIYGSIDVGVPIIIQEYQLTAKLLQADVKVVEGGKHMGTEASPVFLAAVRGFLKKHPAASASL